MLFTLKDLRTFYPQKWPFSRKKTATKWRMRKYTELPEDYLQTSWIVSVLIKIPCIYMILWLILPGKDIRHNQNNILQKFFVCNSKIEKTNLITSSSLLNSYTVSPRIAWIFVQKIHHAIWNRTVWIYTMMFVKSHAILRNRAILLTRSNILGPKS